MKFFEDIGVTKIIGFIVICILGVLYFYFNPSIVRASQIQIVTITLSEKPKFSSTTYEISESLKLIDNNYEQRFQLGDCALSLINKIDLLSLNVGDQLRITAKADELKSGKAIVNNYISVYGIELPTGKKILDFGSYNACKRNGWKKFIVIGVLFALMFILRLFKKKWKG